MARTIDATTIAETNKRFNYPIQLVKFQVTADNADSLFLNSGYKSVVYGGDTYIPGSNILGISPVEETKDVRTSAISIKLAGIPNTIIAALENVDAIGGIVTIYQAFWDQETNTIAGTVYQKWQGIINSHAVDEENTESGNVNITVECKNIVGANLNTKNGRYTSNSSFRTSTANDASMAFVASMVAYNPKFGKEDQIYNNKII